MRGKPRSFLLGLVPRRAQFSHSTLDFLRSRTPLPDARPRSGSPLRAAVPETSLFAARASLLRSLCSVHSCRRSLQPLHFHFHLTQRSALIRALAFRNAAFFRLFHRVDRVRSARFLASAAARISAWAQFPLDFRKLLLAFAQFALQRQRSFRSRLSAGHCHVVEAFARRSEEKRAGILERQRPRRLRIRRDETLAQLGQNYFERGPNPFSTRMQSLQWNNRLDRVVMRSACRRPRRRTSPASLPDAPGRSRGHRHRPSAAAPLRSPNPSFSPRCSSTLPAGIRRLRSSYSPLTSRKSASVPTGASAAAHRVSPKQLAHRVCRVAVLLDQRFQRIARPLSVACSARS